MSRIRTFIALDLGATIVDRMVALQENLTRAGAEVKWVGRDNLHVTLLFLGEVEEREVIEVCRAAQDVARELAPIAVTVAGVGAFPNLRRPRIIWVGLGAGEEEVCTLHDELEKPLLELGCYRREKRQYTPHITLGRNRSEGGPTLEAALRKYQTYQAGKTTIDEVLVMGSELTPKGPIYTVLGRAPLQK